MPLPQLNITFSQAASNTPQRNSRGTLYLIIKEGTAYKGKQNPLVLTDKEDIPTDTGLSDRNREIIRLALKGGETAPKKVLVYVIASKTGTLETALNDAANRKIDWIAIAGADDSGETKETDVIKNWVLQQRKIQQNNVCAVLSNCEANSEYIVNFVTDNLTVGENNFNASEYTARIAGIICGTELSHSITYTVLDEVSDCPKISKQELNAADESGKLIAFWDGEKVKLGRGVNSLTSLSANQSEDSKKIKISQAKTVIEEELKRLCEDNYIGKFANNYSNRCILLSAVRSYFETLKNDGIVSDFDVSFDIESIKKAFKENSIDYSDMTDEDVQKYDFKTYAFIKVTTKILDAIEDVAIDITI